MNHLFFILLIIINFSSTCLYAQKISFNNHWQFIGIEFATKEKIDSTRKLGNKWNDQFLTEEVNISDSGNKINKNIRELLQPLQHLHWKKVQLPHIAFPEPLVIVKPREGIAWYKKSFHISKSNRHKNISIYFEGAMQVADIWLNGKFIKRNTGGYLPFELDITKLVHFDKVNTIYVRLDNRANPLVPPGKPVQKLDFIYYSGIYRNTWLIIKNPLHISSPIGTETKDGGGIFVSYPQVNTHFANISIQTKIVNHFNNRQSFQLKQILLDKNGINVSTVISGVNTIEAGMQFTANQEMNVKNPALWHPNHPNLYTLQTFVVQKEKIVDSMLTQIGIRSFEISKEKGLLINGIPTRITGTNRHQNYPYIGNAISENANYRDAWLIKNAGMNCVRTGHYPPDPSFLKAADELGLLIVNTIPGWQFYNKDSSFQNHVFSDIRQTIRRDRNHASILLWEVSLNEAYPPAEFRCQQVTVAKEEWGNRKNFYTSGDSYFKKACYDVPYDDWNDDPGARNNTTYPNNAFLIREYGDYEFGGGNSTTRQLRANGQDALLQQAWNLQWEHNKNRKSYPRAIGDLNWAFFDGLAGLMVGIEGWGVADIFRIPKFSYYFFQSQRDILINKSSLVPTGPMISIAHYWQQPNKWNNVVVYSNCDEVALYVNDKLIGKQKPDSGPETGYGNNLETGGNPFDAGNANHLNHPPFTFNAIKFIPGTLKAVGYAGEKIVCTDSITTPGNAEKIEIQIAENGKALQANTDDLVFVYASIMDAKNRLVNNASLPITLKIDGDASIVSPATVNAEAGIASFLLKTNKKTSKLILTANTPHLKTGELVISIGKKNQAN